MLTEKTYVAVVRGLRAAEQALDAQRTDMLKDKEDNMIYKRILYLEKRVAKQAEKSQALRAKK
jgi:hypothetical protein